MKSHIKILLLLILISFQASFAQDKKVGIGTFQPEAQLHVKGDGNNQKILKIESSDGTDVLNANNDGSVELSVLPKTSSSNSTYDILTRNKITNKIEKTSSIPLPEADPVWNQARVSTKTYKGNIPSNAELNNYTETGIYNVILDNISVEAQNFPVAIIGVLEVFNSENTTYQIYHTGGTDNSLYFRNRLNSQWSNWRKNWNSEDFNPDNFVTQDEFKNIKPSYKSYLAIVNQDGTDDPTSIVLENNLGGIITWRNESVGIYVGTISGARFPVNKTAVLPSRGINGAFGITIGGQRMGNTQILVNTNNSQGPLNQLYNATIEVRVYN